MQGLYINHITPSKGLERAVRGKGGSDSHCWTTQPPMQPAAAVLQFRGPMKPSWRLQQTWRLPPQCHRACTTKTISQTAPTKKSPRTGNSSHAQILHIIFAAGAVEHHGASCKDLKQVQCCTRVLESASGSDAQSVECPTTFLGWVQQAS